MGFECGIWNWTAHDLGMLQRSGATFSSMTGYISGASRTMPAPRSSSHDRPVDRVGKRLNVARSPARHGPREGGLPVVPCEIVTGAMWLRARDTLGRIADLARNTALPS